MDTEQQIKELQDKVKKLEDFVLSLTNASQTDPQIVRTLSQTLVAVSADPVTNYDRSVNEAGSGSYTVAGVYDGMFEIGGKRVGFYNPV